MIPWTKGMVEIYSILQMEKWLPFCCLLVEFNEIYWAVRGHPKEGAFKILRSYLPYEPRYERFSKIQYIQYPVVEQRFHVVLQTLYLVSDVFSTATWSGDIMLEIPF